MKLVQRPFYFSRILLVRCLFLCFCFVFVDCVNLGTPQGLGPSGILYSSYQIGVSENQEVTTISKRGRACVERIGFFYTRGDASVETAAKNGSIQNIRTVDKQAFNVFLVYSYLCTVVTGN